MNLLIVLFSYLVSLASSEIPFRQQCTPMIIFYLVYPNVIIVKCSTITLAPVL